MDRILEEIEYDICSSSSVDAEDTENNNGVTSLGPDQELEASQKFWVAVSLHENWGEELGCSVALD